MSSLPLYVGLDVGGTTMKGAVVDESGKVYPVVSMPTEPQRGQEQGLATMAETIRRAVAAAGKTLDEIAAIGVATPGLMDIHAGLILDPPNLKPWRNVPVLQYIRDTFRLPTAFQNDANAAAFGEFWIGAGRDVSSMVFFTLGTGIGGGIVLNNAVWEGRHSHGGEIGHMRIELHSKRLCGCGNYGCLEAYASATAVVKRTREALAEDTAKSSSLHEYFADSDDELTSRHVFDAAYAGDALALRIVDETAFYLAVGAANMMATVDPDLIVFGGGMIAAGERFLDRIKDHLSRCALRVPFEKTEIRYATLGSDAGFIGAAACARHLLQG